MSEDYVLKNNELKSIYSDYNFSEQLQNDSLNYIWRQKTGLWTLLSAACNDAAQECYEHIQNYTNKIIDIDTCDIHSLKSISKSVDLEFLTESINEEYPKDVLKLINLLSVPKHILLNSNILLHSDANMKIYGEVTKRGSLLNVKTVPLELLLDIKKNINHLYNILMGKYIFSDNSFIFELLKSDLPDLEIKKMMSFEFDLDLNNSNNLNDELFEIYNLTLKDIFNAISNERNQDLINFKEQKIRSSNGKINYFYLLINIIKQNFYNKEYGTFIDGIYFNEEENKLEDHSSLIMRIVSSIYYDNDSYINDFVCYHFYNLFKSKLFNDELKSLYTYDYNLKIFTMNNTKIISEFTEEEFKDKLASFIGDEDAETFIEKNYITIYTKSLLTFVEYLDFADMYSGLNNKSITEKVFDYDVISLNFPEKINCKRINPNLYKEIIENEKGLNSAILNIAKELTNIVFHISYIRENIKNNIQKYGIVGTKKIVLDNLLEFFIKNYTVNNNWNFQSNFVIDHCENYISSLFTTTTNLVDNSKNNFSINLVEYYDSTNYLNIESDLGEVKVGDRIIGYEMQESIYLDENNLIASSYIEAPIYETVYAPCAEFILTKYNDRFWENYLVNYISDQNEKYLQYYEQYFKECEDNINNLDKITFINTKVRPLIEKIWDEFALSGYSELSKDSEVGDLFVKYIGNSEGENRYLNHENTIFPTIASFQNIDGLIEISKFESDILFLTKYYYENVMNSIINYTKLILKMYDENCVPYHGWMQSYITFHGYTTKYQYSLKQTSKIKDANKLIDVDGPWSYSIIEDIYFNYFENKKINVEDLIKYADIIDSTKFNLSGVYDYYLNEMKDDPKNIFFGENPISGCVIDKIEYDMFNNSYTLIKKKDEIYGKLIFRSYETLIGLPIENFLEYDGYIEDLVNISNSCIDFGIINDVIWIFGFNNVKKVYQLITFKMYYDYNHIIIDDESLRYFSNEIGRNYLDNLNDYICTVYDEKLNVLNFVFFNQFNELKKLSEYSQIIDLTNTDVNFYINKLNLNNDENHISVLSVKNIVFPLILDHDMYSNENKLQYNEKHRIWKNKLVDITNYVCYEALNVDQADEFQYYKELDKYSIKLETLNISWNIENFEFKNNKLYFSDNIKISKGKSQSIILNNILSNEEKVNKVFLFLNEYPKCYIKDGHLNIDIIPVSISENFNKEILKDIASKIIEENSNLYDVEFTFKNVKETIFDKLLADSTFSKNKNDVMKLIDDVNKCNEYLNGINFNFYKNNEVFIDSSFRNDSKSSELFRCIPNSKSCLFEPLKLYICFENESGVSFIDDFAIDVDVTCYINDAVERTRKVGYGNKYQKTQYISWSGDKNIESFESITVDVLKYIRNHENNNEYMFDDNVEIILNVCWFDASQIKNGNVYIIISWQNIIEKVPLTVIGENGGRYSKTCDTKAMVININKNDMTLTYDIPKQYFALKLALKDSLVGLDDGIPDFQIGLINIDSNEITKIINSDSWITDINDDYFIYLNKNTSIYNDAEIKYITILLNKERFDFSLEKDLFNKTKMILNEYINIILKDDVKQNVMKLYEWEDIRLNEIYFGLYCNNIDMETNVNYFYYGYVKPGFFKESFLKSNVRSNYVTDLTRSHYPIMIAMKEEIRDILKKEEI